MFLDKYSKESVDKWSRSLLIYNREYCRKRPKSMKKLKRLKNYGEIKNLIQENLILMKHCRFWKLLIIGWKKSLIITIKFVRLKSCQVLKEEIQKNLIFYKKTLMDLDKSGQNSIKFGLILICLKKLQLTQLCLKSYNNH